MPVRYTLKFLHVSNSDQTRVATTVAGNMCRGPGSSGRLHDKSSTKPVF